MRPSLGSLGSLDPFGCALGVVGLICGHWVNSGVLWGSLGSFGFAVGVVLVHYRQFGSFWCALGLVGFIWGLSVG